MSKLFPEYKKFDLSEINKEVNAFWKENKIFERSDTLTPLNHSINLLK